MNGSADWQSVLLSTHGKIPNPAMKAALKKSMYAWFRGAGVYRLARWLHRRRAVILTYHGVLHKGEDSYANRNCVSAKMFERQMAYVARHYRVMSLPELVRRLTAKEKLLPYTLVITFDDGFRNNYSVAAPILRKYRLPATVFLTTAFIDSLHLGLWTERVDWMLQAANIPAVDFSIDGDLRQLALSTTRDRIIASDLVRGYLKRLPPKEREAVIASLAEKIGILHDIDDSLEERYAFLTWDQIREMSQWQITFGSHTHTHSILSTLSPAEVIFELAESRRRLEPEIDMPCTLFSYPNGTSRDFGRRDEQLLRKLGYTAAVSQISGFNDHKTRLFALRRINITRNQDFNYFLAKITGVWSLLKLIGG